MYGVHVSSSIEDNSNSCGYCIRSQFFGGMTVLVLFHFPTVHLLCVFWTHFVAASYICTEYSFTDGNRYTAMPDA